MSLRDGKLGEVILKDILVKQLQEINSFEYKGSYLSIFFKKYSKGNIRFRWVIKRGLNVTANAKISDQLILGNSYQEELIDGVKVFLLNIFMIF